MLYRACAGGVVFFEDKVLLLQNEKNEWVLPKGLIRAGMLPSEVAVSRVRIEAGVEAEVVCPAGSTSYEFYSHTRQKPVCNEITWFVMKAESPNARPSKEDGFKDGGFEKVSVAIKKATYSQDRALIKSAYERYNRK